MKHPVSIIIFALALALTYTFVVHSGAQLPPLPAVHFDAAGNANSFMPHAQYIRLMCAFGLGLPLCIVGITTLAYSRAGNFKVPNRDYWMAPQREQATRTFLIGHGIWFGTLLCALLCFVHWIVVIANRQQPPHLSNGVAVGGLVLFLAMALAWAMVLMVAFRRPR